MRGYIPEGDTNRLGCGIALVWLFLSFPFLLILMLSGGGCEGAPQPCQPKSWPVFAFVGVILLLGVSTAWSVKQLRSGTRGPARWIATIVAVLLVGFAAFVVWLLTQF